MRIRTAIRYAALAAIAFVVVALCIGGVFWKRLVGSWHRRGLDECAEIDRLAEENDRRMFEESTLWYWRLVRSHGVSMPESPAAVYYLTHDVFGVPGNAYFFRNTRAVRHYHLLSLRELGCELTETENRVLDHLEAIAAW
jgi:hypothetical protein